MNEYTFDEIEVGMSASFKKLITKEMEDSFRMITGDENPLHKDDSFALEMSKGKFKGHVAFGMLTASLYSTVAGECTCQENIVSYIVLMKFHL